MFHVPQYCLKFVTSSTQTLTFVPGSPGINAISPVSETPGKGSIMWMSYLVIRLPRRMKKRPMDCRSAIKQIVGRKSVWIKLFDTSGKESILVSDCSWGFETRLYVHSSFAIILIGKWLLCLVCLPGVS